MGGNSTQGDVRETLSKKLVWTRYIVLPEKLKAGKRRELAKRCFKTNCKLETGANSMPEKRKARNGCELDTGCCQRN